MGRLEGNWRRELLNELIQCPYMGIGINVETWSRRSPEGLLGNLRQGEARQVRLICEEGRGVHVQILRALFACWIIVVATLRAVAVDPYTASGVVVRPVHVALKESTAVSEDLGSSDTTRSRHL